MRLRAVVEIDLSSADVIRMTCKIMKLDTIIEKNNYLITFIWNRKKKSQKSFLFFRLAIYLFNVVRFKKNRSTVSIYQ